jgi:hypothetical protein
MVGHVGPGGHGLHAKVRGQKTTAFTQGRVRQPFGRVRHVGQTVASHARRAVARDLGRVALLRSRQLRLRDAARDLLPFCFPSILERDPSRLEIEFVFIVSFCYFPNRCVFHTAVVNSSSTL